MRTRFRLTLTVQASYKRRPSSLDFFSKIIKFESICSLLSNVTFNYDHTGWKDDLRRMKTAYLRMRQPYERFEYTRLEAVRA
jgi:hypothetical protein